MAASFPSLIPRRLPVRWFGPGAIAVLVALAASACSDPPLDCDAPIVPGSRYRVTLGPATPTSDNCRIVNADLMPMFEVVATAHPADAGRRACKTTPAAAAPPQRSIVLDTCRGASSEQLGTYCTMRYPSMCDGTIWFYFDTPAGAPPIDWRAPVIDAVFKVRDEATDCFSTPSNCTDEYLARLERLQ